jgi:HTH-type transcriptional regulator, pleiotropic regulator of extracellular virulence genes
MITTELPFNVSLYFDENLREVPRVPVQMAQAVRFLIARIEGANVNIQEKLRLAGGVGVFARILGNYATAQRYLDMALTISDELGDERARLLNQIRLAQVYQLQENFAAADRLYAEILNKCESDPDLEEYLDLAYYHCGKSKLDQGRYAEAEQFFQRSLDLREAKGQPAWIETSRMALEAVSKQRQAKLAPVVTV